jgi:hypothetical protein
MTGERQIELLLPGAQQVVFIILAFTKRRLLALFFVALIVFGATAPTALTLAAQATAATPAVSKINNTPAPALKTLQSDKPAAADATVPGSGGSSNIFDKLAGKLSNQTIDPVSTKKPLFVPHDEVDKRSATSNIHLNAGGSQCVDGTQEHVLPGLPGCSLSI